MNLGSVILDIRNRRGLKQGELAAAVEISQTYLSQVEKNKKEPSLSLLKKISSKLEVPLPIIFFLSIDSDDVIPSKAKFFDSIYPLTKDLIFENLIN